jgi:hypothetical protein
MGKPSFQGTLHKFCSGAVKEPTHRNAAFIADHFGIDREAMFSAAVATAEARRLGLLPPAPPTHAHAPTEPQFSFSVSEPPPPPLNFADRHQVSPSDWATLQAVKLVLDDRDLDSIRRRAAALMERAKSELAERMDKARS